MGSAGRKVGEYHHDMFGMYCVRIVMNGQNLVTAIVVRLKHYSACVTGGQCREEGRRPTIHVVNMLCMLIHIYYTLFAL